jgi:hypothetical protein
MKETSHSWTVGRDSVEPKLDFFGKSHGSTESRPTGLGWIHGSTESYSFSLSH